MENSCSAKTSVAIAKQCSYGTEILFWVNQIVLLLLPEHTALGQKELKFGTA